MVCRRRDGGRILLVLVAAVGLLAGGTFLYVADQALPHLHVEFPDEAVLEGPKVAWRRSALLMLAMTLHNFPEGMAVGVSFGGGELGQAVAWRSESVCKISQKDSRSRADVATIGFIVGFTVMMSLDNALA